MKSWDGDDLRRFARQLSQAAVGELPWTTVLEALRVRFDAVTVALNTLLPTGSSCGGIVGVDQATFEEYASQWAEHDPNRVALTTLASEPGSLVRTHEAPEFDRVITRHDIYPGWMRPREFRHGAWLTAWGGEAGLSGLAIYRSPSMGWIDDDLFAFLDGIAFDFITALRVYHRLQAELHAEHEARGVIESRGGVVIRLDSSGKVIALSDRAGSFIATGGALAWGDLPLTLQTLAPTVRGEFARIVHEALTLDRSALLALPASGRALPYELMVVPVSGPGDRGAARKHEVLLVVADPAAERDLSAPMLRALYGFTPAEAEVARALARGLDVQAIAERHKVSKETLRTQLKALYAKTDTRRQTELVRLLMGGLASVHTAQLERHPQIG